MHKGKERKERAWTGTGEEEAALDPLWGPVQLEVCCFHLLKLAAWDAKGLRRGGWEGAGESTVRGERWPGGEKAQVN